MYSAFATSAAPNNSVQAAAAGASQTSGANGAGHSTSGVGNAFASPATSSGIPSGGATVTSATSAGPSQKKFRRSASGKLVRDMLEHSVICTAPVRQNCSECKELRAALSDHASRCTRVACSMPFCGVKKNPKALQILEDEEGGGDEEEEIRIDSRKSNIESVSVSDVFRHNQTGKSSSLTASPSSATGSMYYPREPPAFLSVRPSTNRSSVAAASLSLPRVRAVEPERPFEEDGGGGEEDGEDGADASAAQGGGNDATTTGSAVTMTGTFDGRMTFYGQWFYDVSPSIVSDFGYVFKGDDVSDPDGSLPCFACKKPGAHSVSESEFIVCDLCDQVFHLACAKLESIPHQQAWYCSGCADIRARLVPSSLAQWVRLPPTRSWTGFFLLGEKRIAESFRLEFDWRNEPDKDGIIASVKGKGKNSFGHFTISGKLAQPVPPKTSFALTLAKTYDT